MVRIKELKPVVYQDEKIYLLDQTKIPIETKFIEIDSIKKCYDAIKRLSVRGAPAIGIAAGYGFYLSAKLAPKDSFDNFYKQVKTDMDFLNSSRPTAVNLSWALNRMNDKLMEVKDENFDTILKVLEKEAMSIQKEDEEAGRKIGEYGSELLEDGMGILTHCNAGFLATSKYGTALAPIYVGEEKGMKFKVFADETRPLLQGSRLTAYELYKSGVDVTVITDSMAAAVMQKGWVDAVIVGCDRAAANGDIANKIGTYGVALLARAHNIPFYVALPTSTIDLKIETGADIPIEERDREEITHGMGKQTAPDGVNVYNPAFDVTPHYLVDAIITEKGVIRAPYTKTIKKLFE